MEVGAGVFIQRHVDAMRLSGDAVIPDDHGTPCLPDGGRPRLHVGQLQHQLIRLLRFGRHRHIAERRGARWCGRGSSRVRMRPKAGDHQCGTSKNHSKHFGCFRRRVQVSIPVEVNIAYP